MAKRKAKKKKKRKVGKRRKERTSSKTLAHEAFSVKPDEFMFEEESSVTGGRFQDNFIVLYGPPKIGKSKMLSKFPGVYLLPTEPGFTFLNIRKTRIPNWITFTSFIKKLEKKPSLVKQVDCWGVDTADNLSKFCMQYVCGREGVTHPSDLEWGKGWEALYDEFSHWILRLSALGPGVIFVCHEKEREITSRGLKTTKLSPDLVKTCYTILNNLADITLHMGYSRTKRKGKAAITRRCLHTKPSVLFDAGDRTGLLPETIPFKTEAAAVKEVMSYFEE